ncbi:hypothetical protein, partial [Enterobacter cloacae complex sp. 2DZ2F20B]|uniref:hypothetical protein n=1 Tax=Enterobacter cloacae complex sp. 2DZ2F20B TaxID=2511993 RepID=UPI0010268722
LKKKNKKKLVTTHLTRFLFRHPKTDKLIKGNNISTVLLCAVFEIRMYGHLRSVVGLNNNNSDSELI